VYYEQGKPTICLQQLNSTYTGYMTWILIGNKVLLENVHFCYWVAWQMQTKGVIQQ